VSSSACVEAKEEAFTGALRIRDEGDTYRSSPGDFIRYRGVDEDYDSREYFLNLGRKFVPEVERQIRSRRLTPRFAKNWGVVMMCHGFISAHILDDSDGLSHIRAGKVYAQPLLWRRPGSSVGELIVVTEHNEVFALDTQSGKQIWKRALGSPVQRSALPCGNISPLGVTGAPVIDEQRATLYLDAAVMRGSGPRQEIFALSLADGSIEPGWPLDVAAALGASFDPSVQNQRGALALFKGKIFLPFSGHWGDCGAYRFVVGVSIDDPSKVTSFSTRARRRHMGAGRC
jgi:hypothetical protein